MVSESSAGCCAVLQLLCYPSKEGGLSKNILQSLSHNLTPQTVQYFTSFIFSNEITREKFITEVIFLILMYQLNPPILQQDPASRAILQEEFISRDEGAKEDDAASSRKSETAGNSNSSPAPAASSSSIECRVCSQQTEAPVVFLPCKHRITCGECAPRIKKCLECRAEIKEKVIHATMSF